jgi:hypothetical protein
MTQAARSHAAQRSPARAGAPRPTDPRVQAYLVARETLRRIKQSPGPCFARDWRLTPPPAGARRSMPA